MSDSKISRREAMHLAQFGVLLGTGLCASVRAEAQRPALGGSTVKLAPPEFDLKNVKLNPGAMMTVKLYVPKGEEQLLVRSIEVPAAATAKIIRDPEAAIFVKFWRPPASSPLSSPDKVYFSYLQKVHKADR